MNLIFADSSDFQTKSKGRLFLLMLVGLTQISIGRQLNENEYRVSYPDRTQIPDGVAVHYTLDQVNQMPQSGERSAAKLVEREMVVSPAESQDLAYLMEFTSQVHNREVRNMRYERLCQSGKPKVSGDEILVQMEASEDERERIAEKHLRIFERNVGQDRVADLQQWLDAQKLEMKYGKFDLRALYERLGRDPAEHLDKYCENVAR